MVSIRRKKVIFIAAFLIIAAVAVVLCVSYFTKAPIDEFEGTLIHSGVTFQFV